MLLRAAAIFLFLFTVSAQAQEFAHQFEPADPEKTLPAFVFQDEHGITHDLKDYKGHYILIDLWASWCGPCVHEMPAIDTLPGKLGQALDIVPISEDRHGATAARAFYTAHNIKNLPVFYDGSGQILWSLHITGLPTAILIDPEGKEIGRIEGETDWASNDAVNFLKTKTGAK